MSRNKVKRKPLFIQMKDSLDSKLAIGESKKAAKPLYGKDADGNKIILKPDETKDKIYSWNTYRTYLKQGGYFTQWCKDTYGCKTLETCKKHANEYLQKLIDEDKSPYTIKMVTSALVKIYGCDRSDFIETPSRHRADIKRSRGDAERDKHFSEKKNAELISFCRSTGLRRAELEHLVGTDLEQIDGKYYVHVQRFSKGGRERYTEIVGTDEEIQSVINKMRDAGANKVWGEVSSNADIHGYRSDYCNRVYDKYARPTQGLKRDEIYYCKGELSGVCYDKKAMEIASKNLGHNRINVIATNYLRAVR